MLEGMSCQIVSLRYTIILPLYIFNILHNRKFEGDTQHMTGIIETICLHLMPVMYKLYSVCVD